MTTLALVLLALAPDVGFEWDADIAAFLGATACPGELEVIGDQTADGIAPPA